MPSLRSNETRLFILQKMATVTLAGLMLHFSTPGTVRAQDATTRVIGVIDGPPEYTFGWIDDVKFNAEGQIFVLDTRGFGLRWYEQGGTYVAAVGRPGQGPGELRHPAGIGFDGAGRLHVLDTGNAKIATYEIAGGEARHVGDRRITIPRPVGFCAAGERQYVMSDVTPELIHELDAAGGVVRSFGRPPQPDRETAREFRGGRTGHLLAQGTISCDAVTARLLYGSLRLGELHMYDLDGNLQWQVTLPGFTKTVFRYNATLGMCCELRYDRRTGTHDHLVTAVVVGHAVLVSVRTWSEDGRQSLETRVLQASDGAQIARSPSRFVVSAVDERGARAGYTQVPFPQVMVARGR